MNIPAVRPLTQRQQLGVGVLIGFLLVLGPLYLPLFHLDLSSRTYTVEPVTVDNGTINVASDSLSTQSVDGIACSGWRPDVDCAYERERLQQGTLELNLTDPRFEIKTPYVYHPIEGQSSFYRRTADDPAFPQTITLEPVEAETVVESVASSPNRLPVRVRLALRTGTIRTDRPLPAANRIIDTDDGYVMLVETQRRSLSSGDTVEALFSALFVVSGLIVFWRTYRRLPSEW